MGSGTDSIEREVGEGFARVRYEGDDEVTPGMFVALNDVEQQVAMLREAVADLGGRLDPVLRPDSPNAFGVARAEIPQAAPVTERIRELSGAVAMIRGSISAISDRLDL